MSSFGNGMHPPAAPAPALALALNGVGKSYGGAWALAPLDLEVVEGERLAVLGPSGSGKTTLLHLIGRVIQPEQGVVEVDGQPLRDLGPGKELAALVGVMHQQLDLVPHLSVVHNIMAGRLGFWSLWRSLASLVSPRDRHLAQVALDRVGIPDKLYERTAHLSGGEQQRVALARLLVQHPKVVLADEPVASLDPGPSRGPDAAPVRDSLRVGQHPGGEPPLHRPHQKVLLQGHRSETWPPPVRPGPWSN